MMDLGQGQCLPPGLDERLDFKTGAVYCLNSEGGIGLSSMTFPTKEISGFNFSEEEDKGLELKLDLSTSNALKSKRKNNSNHINDCINDNSVSEVESSLRLVGCLTCLTYYMVCRRDGRCPRCKGSFLLDFLGGGLSSP
ncbi:hypothetical protein SUGI_0731400 [Cryptomeria japonica]|nr:hypothetical protein SUGI_0731400 [Cryptomeria japonica]